MYFFSIDLQLEILIFPDTFFANFAIASKRDFVLVSLTIGWSRAEGQFFDRITTSTSPPTSLSMAPIISSKPLYNLYGS